MQVNFANNFLFKLRVKIPEQAINGQNSISTVSHLHFKLEIAAVKFDLHPEDAVIFTQQLHLPHKP